MSVGRICVRSVDVAGPGENVREAGGWCASRKPRRSLELLVEEAEVIGRLLRRRGRPAQR